MLSQVFNVIALALRASLAAIVIIAGIAKLTDRRSFTLTLMQLGIPAHKKRLLHNITLLIPFIEVSFGFLVVSSLWPIIANTAMFILTLMFNGVIIFALRKAPHTMCRCFGALSNTRFNRPLLVRCVILTISALVVLLWSAIYPSEGISLWLILILIAEYCLIAIVATHAVRVVETIKERMVA